MKTTNGLNGVSAATELTGDAQIRGSHIRKSKESTNFTLKDKIPFRWRYGRITPLSEEEKAKVNQPRGRRHQCKPCAICGSNGGCLTHRKVSDGNPGLICESCAIDYVQSAMKISHVHGFNNVVKKEM